MHVSEIYQNNAPSLFGVWPTSRTFQRQPLAMFATQGEAEAFAQQQRVALKFTDALKDYLGEDWAKVASSDAHPNDLCDANHFLIEAFAAVYGREPFFPSDVELGHSTEEMMNRDCDTLNAIWDASFALWREAGGLTSTLNA